ncbi:MAG: molybdenum ABC transporter ATP-binding protein ModC [Vibrio sp.]
MKLNTGLRVKFEQQLGDTSLAIDMQIPANGITVLFGRSGAGKTSVINAISGLSLPDSGVIRLNERVLFQSSQKVNVAVEQRKVGYVFQEARLFPHYTVQGNLRYGMKTKHVRHDMWQVVIDLLELAPLLTRYPNALSGGEKQRVAIGRALLSDPDILLMDEPLASLDLPRKREVMPFLEQLSERVDIPIVYVTHSLDELLRLAHYLVLIEQGRVVEAGPVEQVWSSETMRPWLDMQERSSLFTGTVYQQWESYGLTEVRLNQHIPLWVQHYDGEIGDTLRVQIRATDVSVVLDQPVKTSIRNIIPAKVAAICHLHNDNGGRYIELTLQLAPACELSATITEWAWQDLQLAVGQSLYAQIKGVSISQSDVIHLGA